MNSSVNNMIEHLPEIKRYLNITWNDDDTDRKLISIMEDGIIKLNHLLGAEIDYFSPGMGRSLFKNYMLYAWNNCLNEFESAYKSDIYKIRHIYEVKGVENAEK